MVKFNKRRHKKSQWITQGIVKLFSYRDKLCTQYRRKHPHIQMHAIEIQLP